MCAWIYILKCADKSFYTGSTTDLKKRIAEHQTGYFPDSYTHSRLPVDLVYSLELDNYNEAFRLEHQIKNWSKKKKEALIKGDFDLLHELAKCKNETSSKYFNKELL